MRDTLVSSHAACEEQRGARKRSASALVANDNTIPFSYWVARVLPLGVLISLLLQLMILCIIGHIC